MLRVYYADISSLSAEGEGQSLSQYRLEKLRMQKRELTRRQGIGAELLLIHALRECFGPVELPLSITTEAGGKPKISGIDLQFSLAHSGNLSVCAISDARLGVDVQMRSTCNDSVIARCFSQDEQNYVAQAEDRDDAFTAIWAGKESYLKAKGTGILFPLASFSALQPPSPARIWHTSIGNFSLAVCLLGGDPVPEKLEQVVLS